ncbi:MAG: cyclic nucleotide-binding domain-containing protein, partial [Elusimicrobiota bacterium]|nr:cyclic nucleotide-binding domain-containing protein [Elusimicrobiota bacterium]
MNLDTSTMAFFYGCLSAVSLPLGAAIGLWLKPSSKWSSSLMSFGAGALLAALTLELVGKGLEKAGFYPLGGGVILGAFLFAFLNKILNEQGGFLRKRATLNDHLSQEKLEKFGDILKSISKSNVFKQLPPDEIQGVLPYMREVEFKAGTEIFKQGDEGDNFYIIETGKVQVSIAGKVNKVVELSDNSVFGEMALISDDTRNATVKVLEDMKGWYLEKDDFKRLLDSSPELKKKVSKLFLVRVEDIYAKSEKAMEAEKWAKIAKSHIDMGSILPSDVDIKAATQKHSSASFAIWLGILLDGIPESLVIGASMIGCGVVSFTLIGGVFLANFPEALSSAVGMRKQGKSIANIIWMWGSLCLLTGVGAFVGNIIFSQIPTTVFVFVQGIAAGAMLAMIAETMLPEASEQGGPATGIMTVLGFLAAIYISTLSP